MENSGFPQEELLDGIEMSAGVPIEYIGLNPDAFDPSKGKSYNEMLLMDMATQESVAVREAGRFFKVTGRFPIKNLDRLIREVERRGGEGMRFFADCKDHRVYEYLRMPVNGHSGESRYWAMSLDFYNQHMRGHYAEMGTAGCPDIEAWLLRLIRQVKHEKGVTIRFRMQAHITGKSGHKLGKGPAFFYSSDNDGFALTLKRHLRQWMRWVMPWWWC